MRVLLTLLLALQANILLAQDRLSVNFTVLDGLPSDNVYRTYQDSKGFIWICTDNGVAKYDGHSFKIFNVNNGLPDNEVFECIEDAKGRIWLRCFNGELAFIYNDSAQTARRIDEVEIPKGRIDEFIYTKKEGAIFVGISAMDPAVLKIDNKGKVSILPFRNGSESLLYDLGSNVLQFIQSDSKDSILLSYKNGLEVGIVLIPSLGRNGYKYKKMNNSRFILYEENGLGKYYNVFQINDGLKIVSTGISSFDLQRIAIRDEPVYIGEKIVNRLNEDLTLGETITLAPDGAILNDFFIDREGNYWLASQNKGLFLQPKNDINSLNSKLNAKALPYINKLYEHGGKLYVMQRDGGVLVKEGGRWGRFDHVSALENCQFMGFSDKSILWGNKFDISILRDGVGKSAVKGLPHNNIKAAILASDGLSYLGSHATFSVYDYRKRELLKSHKIGRTTALCEVSGGKVWIGTTQGVLIYDTDSDRFDTLRVSSLLSDSRVTDIKRKGDLVVVGTNKNGLFAIKGNEFRQVAQNEGLWSNNVKEIFIDERGRIWVVSGEGVSSIDMPGGHLSSMAAPRRLGNIHRQGLVNSLVAIGDTVYVGTSTGLYSMPYNPATTEKPRLQIASFKTDGKELVYQSPPYTIPYQVSNIRIEFAALSFASLGEVLYRYRIKGWVDEWREGKLNHVDFEQIPPGRYVFEVMGSNSAGVWSDAASIDFYIPAPFWQTYWFYALVLVGIGLSIFYVVRRYYRVQFLKKSREEETGRLITELELKAIRSQINPHFIFNSLNSFQYFINNHRVEDADTYLTKLAFLIRKTLDYTNSDTITLGQEVEYLDNYLSLEKLRFGDEFHYEIVDNTGMESWVIPPMVVQPHVENALRHGLKPKKGDKWIKVVFDKEDDELLRVSIEDNGVGFQAKKAGEKFHISKGLELSKAKLEAYERQTGKQASIELVHKSEVDSTKQGVLIILKIGQ